MNKILITTALIALSSSVFASDESFLRLELGHANGQKLGKSFGDIQSSADSDKSGVIALGIGNRVNRNVSFTLVGDYRPRFKAFAQDNVDKYSADLKAIGARANVYYTLRDIGPVAPYITLGAGVSRNKLDKLNVLPVGTNTAVYQYGKKHRTDFMYQAGAGVDLQLNNDATLDVGYRYSDLGRFHTSAKRTTLLTGTVTDVAKLTGKLRSHDIMVGLKYNF